MRLLNVQQRLTVDFLGDDAAPAGLRYEGGRAEHEA